MKRIVFLVSAVLLLVGMIASVHAMTGIPANGEPPMNEVNFDTITTSSTLHDETVDNPYNWYKGWWWVTLTNNTGIAWDKILIKPGEGDRVALVQGNGLEDENGFIGNSIVANKAGSFAYSGSYGSRTYQTTNGDVTGQLYSQALFDFTVDLASGPTQKVSFKIYTDNSYYQGPYASSFSMTLTPIPVPEPSSIIALLGGLSGLVAFARRRK